MQDLPLGFAMSLAQNNDALSYFSHLSDAEKEEIIEHTHTIRSKREMQEFVAKLTESSNP